MSAVATLLPTTMTPTMPPAIVAPEPAVAVVCDHPGCTGVATHAVDVEVNIEGQNHWSCRYRPSVLCEQHSDDELERIFEGLRTA